MESQGPASPRRPIYFLRGAGTSVEADAIKRHLELHYLALILEWGLHKGAYYGYMQFHDPSSRISVELQQGSWTSMWRGAQIVPDRAIPHPPELDPIAGPSILKLASYQTIIKEQEGTVMHAFLNSRP